MNLYKLPDINFKKSKFFKRLNNPVLWGSLLLLVGGMAIGFILGVMVLNFRASFGFPFEIFKKEEPPQQTSLLEPYLSQVSYEEAIINAVKSASPSVISIVVSKDVPIYERRWINPFGELFPEFEIPEYVQKGTKKQKVGAGSGFIVSEDGLVITNKHVVIDKNAEYVVFTNEGEKYPVKVLALDPLQDIAILKIEADKKFPAIKLGDSDSIQIGQTVIAIGNALGEFSNTVSVGVVSGLQRTVSASDRSRGFSETLQGIIQTDAAINAGNSGGPLLNLKGEVIGINTAMAEGAENIGFAIPINMAKKALEQVKKNNKIVYPLLGVRYIMIEDGVKEEYKLSVNYGALILKGAQGEPAIIKNSPAEKAGLKERDIILEINGEKITSNNPLGLIIMKYNPGDKVILKVLRGEEIIEIEVVLAEREE